MTLLDLIMTPLLTRVARDGPLLIVLELLRVEHHAAQEVGQPQRLGQQRMERVIIRMISVSS
jgi:hypothetical protein